MWEDRVGPHNYTHTRTHRHRQQLCLFKNTMREEVVSLPYQTDSESRAPQTSDYLKLFISTIILQKASPCFYRAEPTGLGRRRSAWSPRGLMVEGLGEFISKFTHKKCFILMNKERNLASSMFSQQKRRFQETVRAMFIGTSSDALVTCVNCAHSTLLNRTKLSIDRRKRIVWPIIYFKI